MLHNFQSIPFEVGGIIDATIAGIQKIGMMPGRETGESIDPEWFPNYKIIFHTHTETPGKNYSKIFLHFEKHKEIPINLLVKPISPADLFTTGLFFMRDRTNMNMVCCPEGVYFIVNAGGQKFKEAPETLQLLKSLSQLLDETIESHLDNEIPALRQTLTTDNLAKFQLGVAKIVCETINTYSTFMKVSFVSWRTKDYRKFFIEPINQDVQFNDLKRIQKHEKPKTKNDT